MTVGDPNPGLHRRVTGETAYGLAQGEFVILSRQTAVADGSCAATDARL